ncbi:MAG: amino acid permease [Bacteroidota bacterium]|nr:amino acid permease [Bacteroidota bacterium]MDP4215926.1 amino acid permease [Bacteroidota bacterium]MDP4254587.1 amino acid permease [Bacteroidota bacterium]MDP4257734.1 amino acid permease [Bacteroidota bacterium]
MTQLKKNIGLASAITIVIGSVIGSGIFMKPATMAQQLGSPLLLTAVWLVAGLISIFGAMIYAELGAMMPETGGQYVYTRAMYGEFTAFLYGWSTVAVINTAAVASIAFVCAEYAGYFIHLPRFPPGTEQSLKLHIPFVADIFPLQNFGVKILAIAIIAGITLVNYLSTRSGNRIQFVATILKVLALAALIGGILFSGKGNTRNFITDSPSFHLKGWALFAAFMAAVTGAFASYDGWSNVNMVAGEIKDPKKNISKSLLIGMTACILIYTLINLAYLYVLPVEKMATSPLVAADAMEKVLGTAGAAVIAGLIVISAFGATNINLLANARIVFAMGETKNFFTWAGKVQPRFRTPGNAIIVMGVWSSLFVLSGSFDILADMYIFMSWVFYGLTAAGIFVLRRRMPDAERPYKVTGYPVIPLIFILFTLFYVGVTLFSDISNYTSGKAPVINSVFGLALTAVGAPLYWYFRRQKG